MYSVHVTLHSQHVNHTTVISWWLINTPHTTNLPSTVLSGSSEHIQLPEQSEAVGSSVIGLKHSLQWAHPLLKLLTMHTPTYTEKPSVSHDFEDMILVRLQLPSLLVEGVLESCASRRHSVDKWDLLNQLAAVLFNVFGTCHGFDSTWLADTQIHIHV